LLVRKACEARTMHFDIAILQLIAYASFTLASLTVASVSLLFTFRQNFGWKPIVLPTSYANSIIGELYLEFEVWNRRKYPVVVLAEEVTFDLLSFEMPDNGPIDVELPTHWDLEGRKFSQKKEVRLEPNAHCGFSLTAPYNAHELARAWDERPSIKVYIFDPIKNRVIIVRSKKVEWHTKGHAGLLTSLLGPEGLDSLR
jgi:hypothetical protein